MPRSVLHRWDAAPNPRGGRSRHGRGVRGPVTGPALPILDNRVARFEGVVSSTVSFLRGLWESELADAHFLLATMPTHTSPGKAADGIERYSIDWQKRTITFYRLPITRLAHLHLNDDFHRQLIVERTVFEAIAELLGVAPWELTRGRFNL